MPTVIVDGHDLFEQTKDVLKLGDSYDLDLLIEEVEKIADEYGLEYDGLDESGTKDRPRLRIEVPANRYDLLCLEGIADALMHYASQAPRPFARYSYVREDKCATMHVHKNVEAIRPYCVAAIFRNVTLRPEDFQSFIELQDKLHQNIGRRRTLVAIGTHDLDVIESKTKDPLTFHYDAPAKKGGFNFVPLNQTVSVDGEGLFPLLENTYLKPYLPIIRDFDNTPAIMNAERQVLSIPPIINADFCKMAATTRNIFVECTGTDHHKCEIALDIIVAHLSSKLAQPFTVEPVKIVYEEGHNGVPRRHRDENDTVTHEKTLMQPWLSTRSFKVSMKYVRSRIGLSTFTRDQVVVLLQKMGLLATLDENDEDCVNVECPITRRDILHPCDVIEDIAIAYGFNNIAYEGSASVGYQTISNVAEKIRREIAMCGWRECLTFGLVSLKDAYADLQREQGEPEDQNALYTVKTTPVVVSEPKTKDFECGRPTLIPGILKVLSSNQAAELPISIFEIGDCVRADMTADNKARQGRNVAAIIADHTGSRLEDVHGLLDHVLGLLKLTPAYASAEEVARATRLYKLEEVDDGVFLPGRSVRVMVYEAGKEAEAQQIGIMGVVHPDTLTKFNIPFPCSLFEFTIEPFCHWLQGTEKAAP